MERRRQHQESTALQIVAVRYPRRGQSNEVRRPRRLQRVQQADGVPRVVERIVHAREIVEDLETARASLACAPAREAVSCGTLRCCCSRRPLTDALLHDLSDPRQ